jgi:hypothetical protein
MYATPSSRPISLMDLLDPRYCSALVREMTPSVGIMARRLVISSVMPSAKYPSPGAPRLSNGSTAIRGASFDPVSYRWRPSAKRKAVAATAPTPKSAAARRREVGSSDRGDALAASTAALNSCAVVKRSFGSFASARVSACSTVSGTSGRRERIAGRLASTCCAITACGVGPVNGGAPFSISYSTQPRL